VLLSRSGFTASGVDLARQAGLTLTGRANGSRVIVRAGAGRLRFDAPVPAGDPGRGSRDRGQRDD